MPDPQPKPQEEPNDLLPELDEPPPSGVFHEWEIEQIFDPLTDKEAAEGNRMGLVVDPDDDEDNGLE